MSWSWKKVKRGRLSQLLSDGISERRRKGAGSPLVVETGFPTSIIDLFVKNKDKLKNPLLKRKSKNDSRTFNKINISADHVISSVQSPPPPPPPPPSSLSGSPVNTFSGIDNGDVGVSGVVVEERDSGENECSRRNHLLPAAVSRIFLLVVVLALGTKMFVVGMTFSAFLLLFLEYLVKQRLIGQPCTESKGMINLMRIGKGNQDESNSSSNLALKIEEEQGTTRDCRGGGEDTEIELAEIQSDKEKIDACDEKIEVVYIKDIIKAEAGEEFRTRKSRGAKMRMRMREFLPKNLRKKRTQNVDVGVGNIGLIEEEEDQIVLSSLSSISLDVDVDIVELNINQMEEETTQVIEHSSSSYVSLVVIVLVGLLVGGRVLALILTISWCLLLKLCKIGRRCIEASILRSPAKTMQCS